jgi:hypothetical protein
VCSPLIVLFLSFPLDRQINRFANKWMLVASSVLDKREQPGLSFVCSLVLLLLVTASL